MEDAGADALSLREVARAAGVSPTAVYRHFPDKRALMVAIAEAGVKRLARAQEDAANAATDLRCAFQATGRAYVLFALDNPELFRLIFTYPENGETQGTRRSIANAQFFTRLGQRIIKMLDLRRPIYKQTAAYGHFGRTDVDLPWEHTDKAETLRQEAGL